MTHSTLGSRVLPGVFQGAGKASPNEKQKQSFLEKVASLRYEQSHMANQPNGKVH